MNDLTLASVEEAFQQWRDERYSRAGRYQNLCGPWHWGFILNTSARESVIFCI